MAKIFVQLAHDPEAGTQAQRAFLIASAAVEEGHEVALFLAGGAVRMMKDEFLHQPTGFGPILRDYYDNVIRRGGKVYLSQEAVQARGMSEADLAGKQVELAPPVKIVQLAVEHDRVLTYG